MSCRLSAASLGRSAKCKTENDHNGKTSIASPLLTLKPQNVFHIGMGFLWSYCNLQFRKIYILIFKEFLFSNNVNIIFLQQQFQQRRHIDSRAPNVFNRGMASLRSSYKQKKSKKHFTSAAATPSQRKHCLCFQIFDATSIRASLSSSRYIAISIFGAQPHNIPFPYFTVCALINMRAVSLCLSVHLSVSLTHSLKHTHSHVCPLPNDGAHLSINIF